MKALIIIDMQNGCFRPESKRYNRSGTVDQINLLSKHFRKKNYTVIYIQHNGTKENMCIPGTSDFDLLPELDITTTDLIVEKEANEAFYKTNLEHILKEKNINELYLCGQASNFCLDATIKSALSKDYNIFVASDAHTTAETIFLPAKQMIDYHNWLWENLTPTKYPVTVCTTKDIIEKYV